MSIVSNTSTAFFSDCNTFAAYETLLAQQWSLVIKIRAQLPPEQLISSFGLSLVVSTGIETSTRNH